MAVDAVVSRELKSLQEELSASQRERLAAPAAASSATAAAGEPVGQRPAGSSTSGNWYCFAAGSSVAPLSMPQAISLWSVR